ncbi:MAG: V-type ATP synthase subunit F, partial [Limnochordia bacterium]
EQAIDRYKDSMTPAVILIPSNQGSLGIGMRNLKKSVERAIGADILFRDA